MPLRNLAWLIAVPAAVALALALSYSAPPPDKDYRLVRQIVDVLAVVDENYVRELNDDDRQKLIEDMIDGGLHQLDPHSEYLNEKQLKEFETASEGAFGGVGIVLGIDADTKFLKVEHPMPGTPAYDGGVVAGDLIVKVGSTSTEGITIEQARKLITGEVGSNVTLTIRRAGRNPTDFDVVLTRGRVEIHPVAGATRRTDDPAKWEWFVDPQFKIALIRIRTFSELVAGDGKAGGELQAAIAEIEQAGGRAIILDLRGNLGGLLDQAVKVSDLFLTEGKIVSTRDRRNSERVFSAKADGTMFVPKPGEPRPIAILVDGQSASASEIVTAALQDHNRAIVVGGRTYGKGSVQRTFEVSKDPAAKIKLTVETYWRPSGQNIDRPRAPKGNPDEWGVKPNAGFDVPVSDAEYERWADETWRLDWVAGNPSIVGMNPPKAPFPKRPGKRLYDASQPYEDKVLNRALQHLRKELGGVGAAPAPIPGPAGALPTRIAA